MGLTFGRGARLSSVSRARGAFEPRRARVGGPLEGLLRDPLTGQSREEKGGRAARGEEEEEAGRGACLSSLDFRF